MVAGLLHDFCLRMHCISVALLFKEGMCRPVVSVSSSAMRAVWLRRWVKSGRWTGLRVWSVAGGLGVVLEVGGAVVTEGWWGSQDGVPEGCAVSCGRDGSGGSG